MLCDQLCVFTDNKNVRAAGNSEVIDVMPYLGKGKTVPVTVAVTEAYPAAATVTITVQESTDGSTFTDIASHDVPRAALARVGATSFALPANLRGPKARLAYAVTGTPSTGKLWVGITRDAIETMEPGMYCDKGKVVL